VYVRGGLQRVSLTCELEKVVTNVRVRTCQIETNLTRNVYEGVGIERNAKVGLLRKKGFGAEKGVARLHDLATSVNKAT
jgi:hypothetical protein